MDQLIEGMLAVGAWLAPDDRPGLIVDTACPSQIDALAVALHLQLLQIGGKAAEMRRIGHHADGLGAEEVVVPDGQQTQQQRQIARRRRGAEMLVHRVEAGQHVAEAVGPTAIIVDRPIALSIE